MQSGRSLLRQAKRALEGENYESFVVTNPSSTTSTATASSSPSSTGASAQPSTAPRQGISHAAILKRAKRDQWARDLGAKIQARSNLQVTKAAGYQLSYHRKACF